MISGWLLLLITEGVDQMMGVIQLPRLEVTLYKIPRLSTSKYLEKALKEALALLWTASQ